MTNEKHQMRGNGPLKAYARRLPRKKRRPRARRGTIYLRAPIALKNALKAPTEKAQKKNKKSDAQRTTIPPSWELIGRLCVLLLRPEGATSHGVVGFVGGAAKSVNDKDDAVTPVDRAEQRGQHTDVRFAACYDDRVDPCAAQLLVKVAAGP